MKHISNYNLFIKEDIDTDESIDTKKYSDIKLEVTQMIKKSFKTEDSKLFDDFIEASIKSPDDTQIEGLINDSDIYEFYLKWRNDIDEVLNDIKFFDENPVEINAIGLYDYVIKGTERALQEVVKMIK